VKELVISQELIDGCLKRLPDAQESLYRLVYPSFMKICLRYTNNYDDAANVLQDAFIKIFTRMESFSQRGVFYGWMKRIVVNTAIDYVRHKKQQVILTLEQVPELAEEEKPLETWFIDEKQLINTIGELPTMQLLVFNLFVMDNCSHQEIADRLSISVASSKWFLFDARKILQKKLANHLYDLK
jgi:RNA polymerase sigma factor (sigma-70 family)